MEMETVDLIFSALAIDSPWRGWPFSASPYAGGFLPIAAKFLFLGAIMGGIAWFLRFLYGPKGIFRDDKFETIEQAREREKAEALAAGKPYVEPETMTDRWKKIFSKKKK